MKERKRIAKEHLLFCVKLHKIQQTGGRYFLHEHPAHAASWHEQAVPPTVSWQSLRTSADLVSRRGVLRVMDQHRSQRDLQRTPLASLKACTGDAPIGEPMGDRAIITSHS